MKATHGKINARILLRESAHTLRRKPSAFPQPSADFEIPTTTFHAKLRLHVQVIDPNARSRPQGLELFPTRMPHGDDLAIRQFIAPDEGLIMRHSRRRRVAVHTNGERFNSPLPIAVRDDRDCSPCKPWNIPLRVV